MLVWILITLGIVALDQISKLLAIAFLKGSESFVVMNKILRFTYVENYGAAFGMLDDKRWIFMLLSVIGILAMCFFLFKFAKDDKLLAVSLCFVIGGGIGNMIDRVRLGFVVDFIDFYAFPNFWVWVFNVADSFVCVGAGLMILYLILDTIKEAKAKKTASGEDARDDV